jgi:ankyrin repeat protein
MAVQAANWALAQLLMNHGAAKDQRNAVDGDTPLHVAVRAGNVDMLDKVLRCGAGVQERNRNGLTPWELATLIQSEEVQAVFLNFGRW